MCGHLLRRSQQAHNALWAEELGSDPTSPQYALLEALAAWPGSDQRSAGELASLDKSSTMDIVARLARKQWITRDRDPRDSRRDALTLTSAAVLALEQLRPRVRRVQDRLLAPLPREERAGLLADLAAVARVDADVEATSPQRIPGHLVRRAQQAHTALFVEEFGNVFTGPQLATMHTLATRPGIGQRELGELAALDKSTAADIVARLDRRGWLARRGDPSDGRRRLLELTDDGLTAIGELAPRLARVQDRLLAPVAPTRRESLLASLRRIARVDAS